MLHSVLGMLSNQHSSKLIFCLLLLGYCGVGSSAWAKLAIKQNPVDIGSIKQSDEPTTFSCELINQTIFKHKEIPKKNMNSTRFQIQQFVGFLHP